MSPVSSSSSGHCSYGSWVTIHENLCEKSLSNGVERSVANLVKRGVSAHTKGVILGSVFGVLAGIIFIVGIFYLARWFMYREAMAADMVIEPPLSPIRVPPEKPNVYTIQQNPQPLPRRMNTPDPGTYMPNHPYALSYARRDSYPPGHPAAPHLEQNSPVVPPVPLVVPTLSHPYSQHQQEERSPVTPHDANTPYESFMVPDTPEPTIRAPSPLASTVGGATGYGPLSPYEPLSAAMSDETPSTFSHPNSTTPLRGHSTSMYVD